MVYAYQDLNFTVLTNNLPIIFNYYNKNMMQLDL